MLRRLSWGLLVLAAAACSDDPSASSSGTPPPVGPACAEGFAQDARGICIETLAKESCAPGTMAKIGSEACVPVGWTATCPRGFILDPTGAGCTDSIPVNCTGASRATVNGGACVDIGDCSAAFPPAGAAIIVDDSFSAGQIDATHKATIGEAIAAAADGATIAIDSGTYDEDLTINRPLKLVGRCPAEVHLASTTSQAPAIFATGPNAKGVEIRGLSVSGHVAGIQIGGMAQATIEDVLLENVYEYAIIVDDANATIRRSRVNDTRIGTGPTKRGGWGIAAGGLSDVTVDDVMIVGGTDALFVGSTSTIMTATRVLAEKQAPQPPNRSAGILSTGKMSLSYVVLRDIVGDGGIVVESQKASVDARQVVIRNVKVGGSLARGNGAVAFNQGELKLSQATIIGAESAGLVVKDTGSILSATDVTVIGPPSSKAEPDAQRIATSEGAGMGAIVQSRGRMNLLGVSIAGAWGWGIYVLESGKLDAKQTIVRDMHTLTAKSDEPLTFATSLTSNGAEVALEDFVSEGAVFTAVTAGRNGTIDGKRVVVRGTKGNDLDLSGAVVAGAGARITLEESAVAGNDGIGVYATRGSNTQVRMIRSTVHGCRGLGKVPGHGALALNSGVIFLEDSAIFDNRGIGVAAVQAQARLLGGVVAGNDVGVHVQYGSFLVESGEATDLQEYEVRVSPTTRFLDNASRVGTGDIVLPADALDN